MALDTHAGEAVRAINSRRVVTGHDAHGNAVVRSDDVGAHVASGRPPLSRQLIWTTNAVPVHFTEDGDDWGAREIGTTIKNGSVFRVVDDEPGVTPGHHRTDSIDCAVVMSGDIDREMDETVLHFKAGDVLLQRGTIHHWLNHGTAPGVIACVLIGAGGHTAVRSRRARGSAERDWRHAIERRPSMRHLLLRAQGWWDAQRFDQPEWHLAAWPDQKVRHIQLHVAKALGKVVAALDGGVGAASGIDPMARVRDEVLPDVAMYRSQLINTLQAWGVPIASLCRPHARVPSRSAADPLYRVAMSLSRANAQLAAYIEPREHGARSPASLIQEAIQDLHASAEVLATYFAVDVASAHQARLEALQGTPLPASLIERGSEAL